MTHEQQQEQQQQQQQKERDNHIPLPLDPALQRRLSAALSDEDDQAVMDSLNSYAACFCCNPFDNVLPDYVSLQGQAFDLIVVQSQTTGRISSSDFQVRFDHPAYPFPPGCPTSTNNLHLEDHCEALLEVHQPHLGKIYFPIVHDSGAKKNRIQPPPKCESFDRVQDTKVPKRQPMERGNTDPSSSSNQTQEETAALKLLAQLLRPGKNHVRYLFRNNQRILGAVSSASIFLWSDQDRLVICDVDGTITKSNVRGIYDSIVTEKYRYCHDRVCEFMSSLMLQQQCGSQIEEEEGVEVEVEDQQSQSQQSSAGDTNTEDPTTPPTPKLPPTPSNIKVLYLTSRPLFVAHATRKFLANVRQTPHDSSSPKKSLLRSSKKNDDEQYHPSMAEDAHHRLPEGPLLGFGGNFMDVMKMELLSYTVHIFKASVLMEQVVATFCAVAENPKRLHQSLFVAGFGNTMMDVQAYHMAGMDLSQIYLIDKKSRITCLDKNHHHNHLLDNKDNNNKGRKSLLSSTSASSLFKKKKKKESVINGSADTLPLSEDDDDDDDEEVEEKEETRPRLRRPLSKKVYKNRLGTAFQGYHDENLSSHVFSKRNLYDE